MSVDVFRGTSGVVLPPSVVQAVLDKTELESSVITRLGTRVDVPASGGTIPILSSMPSPAWVNETAEKTVGRPTFSSHSFTPYTAALIVPFSNQFRRDVPALYNAIVRDLPLAVGKFIDQTVLYGASPGSGFDTLASVATVACEDSTTAYEDYLAALATVVAGNGDVTSWLLSPQAEIVVLGARANGDSGAPLFVMNPQSDGSIGSILGRPVNKSKVAYRASDTPDTIGFAGDWPTIQYGFVENITVTYSDQATLTDGESTINLFQTNMFALRVEFELGVVIDSDAKFVRLTGN